MNVYNHNRIIFIACLLTDFHPEFTFALVVAVVLSRRRRRRRRRPCLATCTLKPKNLFFMFRTFILFVVIPFSIHYFYSSTLRSSWVLPFFGFPVILSQYHCHRWCDCAGIAHITFLVVSLLIVLFMHALENTLCYARCNGFWCADGNNFAPLLSQI